MAEKKNVYLFFGEDTYSANQKVKFWRNAFEQKHGGDMNIAILEGKKLTSSILESDIQSTPFLAEKRLIIVEDFLSRGIKDEQKKVVDVLEKNLPDFCVIVFIENQLPDKRSSLYKKLNKVGHVEEFKLLMGIQLTNWIQKTAIKNELALSPNLADYLGRVAGSDLWNLSNEINKLKTYSQTNQITKEVIDNLVHPNLSTSIFKFTDFLAHKNVKGAINTMDILMESGEEIVKIIFMIVRHFRILIQVKDLMSRNNQKPEIISKLKQHPFAITQMMQQSPNFSSEKLREIYKSLLQIDIDMKNGKIKILTDDKKELLLATHQFIINVCK
ncbi:DNA polymerase III subunit delta [Patescibacteria group bacterium]|nr:DNA polymerase III subunit delta [Patescibacteria group bacterium]